MPDNETDPITAVSSDNRLGMGWMAFSVVTAAAMTMAVRGASAELSSTLIVMQRAIGGLALCMIAALLIPSLRARLQFTAWRLHVWRGSLIGVSTMMGFYTITQIPLATATVLFFSAPIFATLLAIPIQGERVGPRRLAAIALGFGGVLIVVRPGTEAVSLAVFTALGSSFLFALALITSRRLTNADGPFAAYVSSAAMSILVTAPFALPVWQVPETDWGWVALAMVVVFSLSRNIGDLQAYRYAEAAVLAPLAYTRLILIAAGAYVFFGEVPDVWTWIGGAVIVAAALYIAHRERQLRASRRAPPA